MTSSSREIEELLSMKKLLTTEEFFEVFKNREIFMKFLKAQRRKWSLMRADMPPWEQNSSLYFAMLGADEMVTSLATMEGDIAKHTEKKREEEAKEKAKAETT